MIVDSVCAFIRSRLRCGQSPASKSNETTSAAEVTNKSVHMYVNDSASTPVVKSTTTWNDRVLVDSRGSIIKKEEIFGPEFTITTTTLSVVFNS